MKPTAAAWVYEHVILGYHDANEAQGWCGPNQNDDRLTCACQLPCTWCQNGQHKRCRQQMDRQAELNRQARAMQANGNATSKERRLYVPLGHGPEAWLAIPGRHRRALRVRVWLADRVCRYLCTCKVCARPETSDEAPAIEPLPLAATEQLGLFEEAVAS